MKSVTCTVNLKQLDSNVWGFHFPIPSDISVPFIEEHGNRIICTFGDGHFIHAALISDGKGAHFININKEVRKRYHLELNDAVIITITRDDSKYGIYCPEEASELLEVDADFNTYFHNLTPGKQRSLLYVIAKPKSSDKRIEKAIIISEHLKINNGKLDFKMLHEAFKMGLDY